MTIEQAASFLSASILFMIGIVIVTIGIVTVNNIIHKYWKSFGWKLFPAYFDEKVEQDK